MKDVGLARLTQKQHNDKMDILWAQVEKKTGLSREELEAELYEDD